MKINSAVIKISGVCNLDCSYCYVFNMGDKSFLHRPNFMSEETAYKALDRIKNYCIDNQIKTFVIIIHGGEPLLRGKEFFRIMVDYTNSITFGTGVRIVFTVQTNATLLDDSWIDVLQELGVNIGISVDGTQSNHDLHRVYKNSRHGSYSDVVQAIKQCHEKSQRVDILSVINTSQKPIDVYNEMKVLGISTVSFLLPDSNYEHYEKHAKQSISDWLIEMCKIWESDTDKNKIEEIQPLTIIYALLLGFSKYSFDSYGRCYNGVFNIQTDGNIEAVDTFKVCGDGFTKTNLNVFENKIDDIYDNQLMQSYYYAHQDSYLCAKCRRCVIVDICGGGHIAHRYSEENGFDNPTVYCKEMANLIIYIQNKIIDDMPEEVIVKNELSKLTLNDVFK